MGVLAWVKFTIEPYGGDATRITVMGESAGGLLAALVVNKSNQLSSKGFSETDLLFTPTWLTAGFTAEKLATTNSLWVQAAVLTYAGTDLYESAKYGLETETNAHWSTAQVAPRGLLGDGLTVKATPRLYKAVSPMYTIPGSHERKLPSQLYQEGAADRIILPEWAESYVKTRQKAGQAVEYWDNKNKPHAFLNTNADLGTLFERDAPIALDKILTFLNRKVYK